MEPSYPIVVAIKPDADTSSKHTSLLFLGTKPFFRIAMAADCKECFRVARACAFEIVLER